MKRALLVGVDGYDNFGDLGGCVNDVNALEPYLGRNEDDSPNFECQKRTTATGGATRDGLLRDLDALLAGGADIALLYFAGHGTGAGPDVALVTEDGTSATPGIAFSEVLSKVASSVVGEVVVFLDCCFAGAAGGIPQLGTAAAALRHGVSILAASRGDQTAAETSSGRGLFSTFVEGALDGGAADVLGKVTVAGLYSYLDESFGAWDQRPAFKANVDRLHELRRCASAVPIEELRRISDLFVTPDKVYPLDPSYEPEAEPRDAEKEAVFAVLQKFRAAKLVEPIDADHMYFCGNEEHWLPIDSSRPTLSAHGKRATVLIALGATGHQTFPSAVHEHVVGEVRLLLTNVGFPITLITSLAAGADQLVAEEALRHHGQLHVVVPSRDYDQTFESPSDRARFRRFLDAAHDITALSFDEPSEEAFWAAGKLVVDLCDLLIAIWDGKPAQGLGGTADVVQYARDTQVPVRILWPAGVNR